MAREEKLRIFDLFRKGISVADVIKTSTTPARTLYRWYKEYEESKLGKPVQEIIEEIKAEVEMSLSDTEFSPDWLKVVSKNSITGCLVNAKIREKLSNLLLNQLDDPELNLRIIHALSSCISIHSKLERDYGFYYLLDPNMAMRKVESQGYQVIDPSGEAEAVPK